MLCVKENQTLMYKFRKRPLFSCFSHNQQTSVNSIPKQKKGSNRSLSAWRWRCSKLVHPVGSALSNNFETSLNYLIQDFGGKSYYLFLKEKTLEEIFHKKNY